MDQLQTIALPVLPDAETDAVLFPWSLPYLGRLGLGLGLGLGLALWVGCLLFHQVGVAVLKTLCEPVNDQNGPR